MIAVALLVAGLAAGVVLEQVAFRRRPTGTEPSPGPQARRPRRRGRRMALLLVLLLAVAIPVAGYLYANYQFNRIEKVDVGDALGGDGRGTNYLIVGSDAREGVEGNRSDTMMILHVDGERSKTMSIPRDLLVTPPGSDGEIQINGLYDPDDPVPLITTIRDTLQIPIDRYIEVSFDSFGGLVDAVGGVTINFPNPAFDDKSGLNVTETGDVTLDGGQALAYVRSRQYTEVIDGQPVTDPTADLGRVQRQQTFLRAVLAKAGQTRNPLNVGRTASAVGGGLRVDDQMTLWDAIQFAWRMGRLDPEPLGLPVVSAGDRLRLDRDQAPPALDQVR